MKKYFLTGSAMLVLGGFLASCTHDDLDYSSIVENKKAEYQEVFVNTYGRINPNQTWGFGTATTKGLTRAVFSETWNGVHADCKFDDSVFDMAVPSGAVDLTKGSYTDAEKNATAFYIPETFSGEMNFYAFNIPANAKIYNLGVVTGFNANTNGLIVFYNIKTMTYSISSGSRHTVINAGTLNVTNYANIGDVYNKGTLVLERAHNPYWPNEGGTADVPNDMHIYSNGEGSVMMPDGGDMKAVCDIHGTLYVGNRDQNIVKNVKIQNSTRKYICGIDATGTVENVDGPLETSYVKADLFTFDGNPIYLLPGGHVDVTTLKVINSGCQFYGAANSTGLIEAVNYEFGNKNDFTHTFSNNIYFKVNGGYIKCDNCYAMGHNHYFNNVDEYLAFDGHTADNKTDEYALAADRINAGDAAGSPACGEAWSIGTPDDGNDQKTEVITTTEELEITELIEQGRVFCEDLGDIGDFDFNDVVFDAYVYKTVKGIRTTVKKNNVVVSETVDIDESTSTYNTEIVLLAAGGTLQLSVAGYEVHNEMGGSPVSTIINTITKADSAYHNSFVTVDPVVLGKDFPYSSIIDIPIIVKYNQEVLELAAHPGDAPHKILVPIGTKWCQERERIEEAYPGFRDYVGNLDNNIWENRVDSQLFNHPKDTYKPRSMEPVTTIIRTSTETTYE